MDDLPIQKPNQHQLSVDIITQLAKKKRDKFRCKITNWKNEHRNWTKKWERERLKWEIKPGSWRGRPSSRESEWRGSWGPSSPSYSHPFFRVSLLSLWLVVLFCSLALTDLLSGVREREEWRERNESWIMNEGRGGLGVMMGLFLVNVGSTPPMQRWWV